MAQSARVRRMGRPAGPGKNVEFRFDGEPVLRGSDIEVYRVAALLAGGMSIDDVRSDYPSLSRAMVEAAKAYAQAHPKSRHLYPKLTAKRALRGAGLEALDGVLGDANDSE